jgi:hypothetical protein
MMRCMVCGEEMRLVQSVPDETMLVPGFEHHNLICPSCHDEERRLVFVPHPAPLSPSIGVGGSGSGFSDAALQPIDETAAADSAAPEVGSIGSGTVAMEHAGAPRASPGHQSLPSQYARAANSRVWSGRAELHRARWRMLCERIGLKSRGDKPDNPQED